MRIYYTPANQGDGSYTVHFFDDKDSIRLLEDEDPETYHCEGGGFFDCKEVPEGIQIRTFQQVKGLVEENS
jgi:hypothetical protein